MFWLQLHTHRTTPKANRTADDDRAGASRRGHDKGQPPRRAVGGLGTAWAWRTGRGRGRARTSAGGKRRHLLAKAVSVAIQIAAEAVSTTDEVLVADASATIKEVVANATSTID